MSGDEDQKATAAKRGEIIHPERDLRLDAPGPVTFLDRLVLYRREVVLRAQAAVARAYADVQRQTKEASKEQRALEEELIHNEQWNPEVVRKRYERMYQAEDEEIEHNHRLGQLRRQDELEEREHQLENARRRREIERKQLERQAQGGAKRSSRATAEDAFRQEAEQIMEHGVSGRFLPIAEEFRQQLIHKRGGEEYLTDEDKERIERVFEAARRREESKG